MLLYFKWLVLLMPIVIEAIDDKKSDKNKRQDVYTRATFIIAAALIDALIGLAYAQPFFEQWGKAAALGLGLFVFFFDAVMAKIYGKKVTYLGTTSIWDYVVSKLHPWVLWGGKGLILILTIIIYIW